MADQRITELVEITLSGIASNDVLPIVDISSSQTKKVQVKNLVQRGFALVDNSTLPAVKIETSGITATQIAANAIETVHINASGITLAKMAANSVNTTQIIDSGVTQSKLASNSVATVNIIDSGITQSKLAPESVATINLAASGVTQTKLASGSVATVNIVDGAVTFAKMANDSVNTIQIVDSGITQAKLASNAVATINIIDSGVTQSKLAADSVATINVIDSGITQPKLASGSVNTVNIIDSAVTLAKMASASVSTAQIVASGITQEKLAANAVATVNLVDSGITQTKLAANAIAAVNIIDSGVTQSKLAADAVATINVVDSGITQGKLAAGAVNTINLVDSGITTVKIASGAVTIGKLSLSSGELSGLVIAPSSIPSGSYGAGSIGTVAIEDNAITFAKIRQVASGVLLGRASAGSGNVEEITLTEAGRALLDDADAAAQRTTLGLGTMAVQAASGVVITGGTAVLSSGTISYATINGGVISGITDLAIEDGGTGASNAADARTNLGLAIGSNVQAYDAALASIAGLTTASGEFLYTTAADTYATATITDAGRAILDDADAAAQRATLGLGSLALQNTVGSGNYDASSIITADIANSAITTDKIADSGVTTIKLADASVTANKLASDAVTTAKIIDSGVTTAKIADAAVSYSKIQATSSSDVILGRFSVSGGTIEEIACTSAARSILDDATVPDIRATLGLGTIATQNSVGTGNYDAGSIVSTDIANDAITTAKIIDSGVTAVKIQDNAITVGKIASDAVGTSEIVNDAITTNKVANSAITYAKIQNTSSSDVLLGRFSASGGAVEEIACTSAARSILDDATIADIRTTLGLGTLATQNGSFSGTSTGTNTGDQTITLSGDITGTGTAEFSTTISNDAITTAKIINGAITTPKIVDSGVTAIKLADNSAAIVAGSTPAGNGDFIGQQWLNTNTGVEYTWTGSIWRRQSGLATAVISGDTVYSFTTSYPDEFSASIAPSLNTQVATRFFAGPASGNADAAPTFRAITADDLPKATTAALGVAQAGTGLVTVSGIFNHANSVASGTYYKVTVDEQGHVSAGEVSLVADDIPSIPASKITTGTFGSGFIADEAILASKLANYSVSQFGEAPPVADFIGQFFFNPLEKDLYLWDGNVWNPVGISVGEIIFGGTYNASGNTIASTSSDGAAVGLSIGQPLPTPSATFNRYYVVVESGGTGTSPAPTTNLQPPDILLCNGTSWVEVDVSSTYTAQAAVNVAFTPAANLGSANVQAALEEVSTECRNVNNVASGILATGYGGTSFNAYTKGDILVGSGTTLLKQAVGTNGQVLTADSAFGTGVRWAMPASGTVLSVSVNAPLTVVSGSTTPVISIPDATTSVRGTVILTDSTSTTSSTLAATATAVKSAFDLANAALPRAGGTITGEVVIGSAGTLLFEGSTDNTFEIQLAAADATSDKVVTLPDTTGTIITTGDTGTVTNTMLAGSIADTKLSTISTAGKVSNSATTATSANTANAIVARDSSGNFSAGTIDAIIDEGTF